MRNGAPPAKDFDLGPGARVALGALAAGRRRLEAGRQVPPLAPCAVIFARRLHVGPRFADAQKPRLPKAGVEKDDVVPALGWVPLENPTLRLEVKVDVEVVAAAQVPASSGHAIKDGHRRHCPAGQFGLRLQFLEDVESEVTIAGWWRAAHLSSEVTIVELWQAALAVGLAELPGAGAGASAKGRDLR